MTRGTKSSEFLVTIAIIGCATALRALRIISDEVWMLACGIQGGLFTAGRSLVKAGSIKAGGIAEPDSQPTATATSLSSGTILAPIAIPDDDDGENLEDIQ